MVVVVRVVGVVLTAFVQGIYNYMPDTNHVSTVHSVAAIL
jgi:hypothetical protein